MKIKSLLMTMAVLTIAMNSIAQVTGTFTDSRDGKVYNTVTIGTQTWMSENLAYKTTRGCSAYNEDINNVEKFGYLYDWVTAKSSCPSGWHLPSDDEWKILIAYMGGDIVAGGKLKEAGLTSWQSPNAGSTNESGLTALPGGFRNGFGVFSGLGSHGLWWSSSWHDSFNACYWLIAFDSSKITRRDLIMSSMCSVICIKD